jgi:RP/EB family microtubule-associated protein
VYFISKRNYNPVERRSKGGKDRNSKGSQKTTKSLQANNLHNSASGDTVDLNKMSGKYRPRDIFQIHASLFYFGFVFPKLFVCCLMHIAIGPKQVRGSAVAGGATYSEEIQALSKEVFHFLLVFETGAVQNPLAFSVYDVCRLFS